MPSSWSVCCHHLGLCAAINLGLCAAIIWVCVLPSSGPLLLRYNTTQAVYMHDMAMLLRWGTNLKEFLYLISSCFKLIPTNGATQALLASAKIDILQVISYLQIRIILIQDRTSKIFSFWSIQQKQHGVGAVSNSDGVDQGFPT